MLMRPLHMRNYNLKTATPFAAGSIKLYRWMVRLVPGIVILFVCREIMAQTDASRTIPSNRELERASYVLNLRSNDKPIALSKVGAIEIEGQYYLYVTQFQKAGKTWYRLRLGFFSSTAEAEQIRKQLTSQFPGLWIAKVTTTERSTAVESGLQIGKAPAPKVVQEKKSVAPSPKKPQSANQKQQSSVRPYVINLSSSVEPIGLESLPHIAALEGYQLYVTQIEKKGVVWNRLRVAGFPDRKTALAVLKKVQKDFSGAWLARATQAEIETSDQTRNVVATVAPDAAKVEPEVAAKPEEPETKPEEQEATVVEKSVKTIDTWMGQARRAIITKEYDKATKLLDRVLDLPESSYTQEARELLGVVHERQGKFALAEDNYRDYLKTYPKGEGSARVRQRLATLLTARSKGKKKLKPIEEQKKGDWDLSGSFSQFSSRDLVRDTGSDLDVIASSLFNNLDMTGRYRSDRVDVRTQLSGSYTYDFEESRSAPDDIRVSALYFDARDRRHDFSTRLGRQSRSSGGVLGRFDGIYLGYLMFPKWKLNLTAGYPVELSSVFDKNNRYFAGFDLDMGTFKDYWDMNAFFIHQIVDGVTDRSAVGGELRFTMPKLTVFTLADVDIIYNVLNTGLLVANYFFKDATTVNLVLDYRTTPVLTTTNALIGRTEVTISELLANLGNSEDALRQLAEDRTTAISTGTLGISHPFSPRLQLSGDVSISRQSGAPASGGVTAIPGTDNQYFYSLQLIGSSLLKEGDISILGLRYSVIDFADTYGLDISSRYPLTRAWRANPRFSADYRRATDNTEILTLRPSARIDYRWKNNVSYDIEGGLIWSDDISGTTTNSSNLDVLFELGYRVDY